MNCFRLHKRAEDSAWVIQKIVRGAWTDVFLDECEAFPDPAVHDDQVDAMSGAVHWLDKQRGQAITGSRRSADRKVPVKAPWALG